MKKRLSVVLLFVFVLSLASTAFAASNLVDVPAGHWAYSSIVKLGKAGLIDGYNDGTFKGDKEITRYEMAVLVAKAMDNYNKADDKNKAEILKLITEFSKELDKMDARLTAVEKNQSKLKFDGGSVDVRYTTKSYSDEKKDGKSAFDTRLRLNASAKIDKNTMAIIRFTNYAPSSSNFKADSWNTMGSGNNTAYFDHLYVKTKMGTTGVAIGRQDCDILSDPAGVVMERDEFNWDGLRVTAPTGNFTFEGLYGRVAKGVSYDTTKSSISLYKNFTSVDMTSASLAYKAGKFSAGIGRTNFQNNTDKLNYDKTPVVRDLMKWNIGYVSYLFTPKFSVTGEYAKNTLAETDNTVSWVKVIIGDQHIKHKGDKNIQSKFINCGKNATVYRFTGVDNIDGDLLDNYRGICSKVNYGFSDRLSSEIRYNRFFDKDNSGQSCYVLKAYMHYKF